MELSRTPAGRQALPLISRIELRHLSGLHPKADDEISVSSSAAFSDVSSRSSRKDSYCRKCPKDIASNSPLHNPLFKCSTCHRHYHEGCAEPTLRGLDR